MRQWEYLFIEMASTSALMYRPLELKIRSINDQNLPDWRSSDPISPQAICFERGREGWELVTIYEQER